MWDIKKTKWKYYLYSEQTTLSKETAVIFFWDKQPSWEKQPRELLDWGLRRIESRAVMDRAPSLSASFIKFLLNCSFQPACWHCLHSSGSLSPTPGQQRALSCGTCSKWDLEVTNFVLGNAISLHGTPDPGPFSPSLALNHIIQDSLHAPVTFLFCIFIATLGMKKVKKINVTKPGLHICFLADKTWIFLFSIVTVQKWWQIGKGAQKRKEILIIYSRKFLYNMEHEI